MSSLYLLLSFVLKLPTVLYGSMRQCPHRGSTVTQLYSMIPYGTIAFVYVFNVKLTKIKTITSSGSLQLCRIQNPIDDTLRLQESRWWLLCLCHCFVSSLIFLNTPRPLAFHIIVTISERHQRILDSITYVEAMTTMLFLAFLFTIAVDILVI